MQQYPQLLCDFQLLPENSVQPVGALSKPRLGANVAILQPAGKPGDNSSRQAHLEAVGLHQWEKETVQRTSGKEESEDKQHGFAGFDG